MEKPTLDIQVSKGLMEQIGESNLEYYRNTKLTPESLKESLEVLSKLPVDNPMLINPSILLSLPDESFKQMWEGGNYKVLCGITMLGKLEARAKKLGLI